jgi:hypothetical protein
VIVHSPREANTSPAARQGSTDALRGGRCNHKCDEV